MSSLSGGSKHLVQPPVELQLDAKGEKTLKIQVFVAELWNQIKCKYHCKEGKGNIWLECKKIEKERKNGEIEVENAG